MKIKINLNANLVNLTGKTLKGNDKTELTVREVLAGYLINETGAKEPLRNWRVSKNIYNEPQSDYEMSEDEYDFIEALIKKINDPPLVQGQLLEIMHNAKLKATGA